MLLALFPLEDERYLILQKGLMVFDRIDLFPLLQTPMAAEERTLRDATDAAIAERAAQDRRLYLAWRRSFPSDADSFSALQPQARTGYFRLWGQSDFNSKALFYHSAKRLVMVTAYSMSDGSTKTVRVRRWRADSSGAPSTASTASSPTIMRSTITNSSVAVG